MAPGGPNAARVPAHGAEPAGVAVTSYRPEIDGLRAVAVLSIIAFHAGFPAFDGGFVGVDIFFVISGYLITTILFDDLRKDRFSLARFYGRRVRRILPALLLMLLCCLPIAWWILVPVDLLAFAEALLATLGFSSNLYFWRHTGYFGLEAELNPLLHTWSLAVEEQYYLAFPVLLAWCWRASKTMVAPLVSLALLLSLGLAVWSTLNHPVAAFYLLPTRAWELLVGAVLALYEAPLLVRCARPLQNLLAFLGLGLIAWAVFGFDRYVRMPGWGAIVPVGGAALVIFGARPGSFATQVLAWRPAVGIGLISYGAYLWHQPLFALVRQASDQAPPPIIMGGLACASLAIAYVSWRFVERPFRREQSVGRTPLIVAIMSAAAVLGLFASASMQDRGFESRYSDPQRTLLAYLDYPYARPYREGQCFVSARQIDTAADDDALFSACWSTGDHAGIAVWGDSHAAALASGLRPIVPGLAQFTTGGCPPLEQIDRRAFPECNRANAAGLAKLAVLQPRLLLIHANWSNYAALDVEAELSRTLSQVTRLLPSTRIVLIGMATQWYPSLPVRMVREGATLAEGQRMKMAAQPRLRAIDERLTAVASEHGLRLVSLTGILCSAVDCQVTAPWNGKVEPIAWDQSHMTEAGAALVARALLRQLEAAP
jgi:peptidoglycan/LPS O-acetylase OafA/YrhL/lysophospholipase L1-like esterase